MMVPIMLLAVVVYGEQSVRSSLTNAKGVRGRGDCKKTYGELDQTNRDEASPTAATRVHHPSLVVAPLLALVETTRTGVSHPQTGVSANGRSGR